MTGRHDGRVALVTGGASGIGLAVVRRLVAEGARVAIGDIDEQALAAVAAELGDAVVTVRCDVTADEDPAALAAAAVESFGRLDVAVANAGVGDLAAIVDLPVERWRRVVDVSLTGAFLTVQAAGAVMADGGAIVAVASLNAVQPAAGMSAYCAAKAGVVALVDVAALELGGRGIRVNAVAPGLVRTPMTEGMWSVEGTTDGYVDNTALGRYALPEDIASAVSFLASDEAGFVTGSTLLVDGGAHHLSYPDLAGLRGAR